MQSWSKTKSNQKIDNPELMQLVLQIQKTCVRTSHGQAAFHTHQAAKLIQEYIDNLNKEEAHRWPEAFQAYQTAKLIQEYFDELNEKKS